MNLRGILDYFYIVSLTVEMSLSGTLFNFTWAKKLNQYFYFHQSLLFIDGVFALLLE